MLKTLADVVGLWFLIEFLNIIESYPLDFINSSEAVEISQFCCWLGWYHPFYGPVSSSAWFFANPDFFRLKYSMHIFIYSKWLEAVSDPLCKYSYKILEQWLHIFYHILGPSSTTLLFVYSNDSTMYGSAAYEVI